MTRLAAALLALLCVALAAPAPADAVIPTITRTQIIDLAKSGVGCKYVWGGTCWDPNNKTWKGADCSGYVTVTWQIPKASKTTDCLPHYYTTSTYKSSSTNWSSISRGDMIKGDAMVYNSGSAGHIVLYESGDKWGSAQVYEARGTAYGIVHRTKSVESKYAARRRDSLAPDAPLHPNLSITSSIATIAGQARDSCTLGGSQGIFDWKVGQSTSVNVDVKNLGKGPAEQVKLALWGEEPFIKITRWNIYTDHNHPGSFTLNDTDALQSIGHDNPGMAFMLDLGKIAAGETKRVVLRVKALKSSLNLVQHPDVRAWIGSIKTYYSKGGFDAAPTNHQNLQTFNGGDLRAVTQTDVLSAEVCDQRDNDCDGQVDEGGVCAGPQPDSGVGPNPGNNPGAGSDAWQGGLNDTDGGAMPPTVNPNIDRGRGDGRPSDGCAVGGSAAAAADHAPLLLAGLLLLALRRRRISIRPR